MPCIWGYVIAYMEFIVATNPTWPNLACILHPWHNTFECVCSLQQTLGHSKWYFLKILSHFKIPPPKNAFAWFRKNNHPTCIIAKCQRIDNVYTCILHIDSILMLCPRMHVDLCKSFPQIEEDQPHLNNTFRKYCKPELSIFCWFCCLRAVLACNT